MKDVKVKNETSEAVPVNIVGGSSSGTEYTEGDTDTTIAGGAVMWEDTSDTLRVVSAGKPLPVNVVAGGTSGTEYTEGDTDASIAGGAVMWEDAADTLRAVSAAKPLPVNVVAGAAGGTQYTEADTDASITGTAMLWEDTSDTLRAVSAAKPLPVSVIAAIPAGNNNIGDVDIASIAAGDNNIGNVDIVTLPALAAGTNNIGDVDVLTVPADPFGVNADAASATGSISAKLRFIAATGIPITSIAAGNNNIGDVDIASIAAGNNNIGDVDVASVPTDPFGANADAASATGSISAKLRFIAGTGIPITGTVTVGSHAVTNAGTFATQVDGSALTALQKIDDPVIVDDAGFTPATSSVMMAGFQADESSTDSVDEGDAGAGRMTLDRKVIVNPQPHTAGGLSIFRSLDLDEGTLEIAKNTAGMVYGFIITNLATTVRYIKFYDAASGTAGTGTPAMTVPVPGNASDKTTLVWNAGAFGITFATGICVGAVTGLADNDTGAPGANDVMITVFYK